VLKGEGKFPILFGSTSIAVGTLTLGGYLARPGLTGEWPTIIVVPSEWGVTSAMKDVCRRLARQGFAAVALDLYRGKPPGRRDGAEEAAASARAIPTRRAMGDLGAIVEFIQNPAGFWSNAEQGFGMLAFGEGARFAVPFAARHPGTPLALVSTRLRAPAPEVDRDGNPLPVPVYPLASIGSVVGPVFGASGRDDTTVPVDDVMELRRLAPHAEWALYEGVGEHFTDDSTDGYDDEATRDVFERLVSFFEKHLPVA
jgi:carboxymethylenebutenolidase